MREVQLLTGLLNEVRPTTNSDMGRVDAISRKIEAVLEGIYGRVADEVFEFQRIHWADGYDAKESRNFNQAKERVVNFLEAKILKISEFGIPVTFSKAIENQLAQMEKSKNQQALYAAGQAYDAVQTFINLVRAAKHEVMLVDPYVDQTVLDMLSAKVSGVTALILTGKVKQDFKALAQAFNKQHGILSVRTSAEFHDRFLVIDMAHWFLIGASIKDAGNKIFAITQITQAEVLLALDSHIRKAWESAQVIL